jgi:hypothetical protein
VREIIPYDPASGKPPSEGAGRRPTAPISNFDPKQAAAFFRLILGPPDPETGKPVGCVEVRILEADEDRDGYLVEGGKWSRTYSGYFDDEDRYVAALRRLRGVSAYVTVNPVNPALRARANNRLKKAKATSGDKDVVRLRWLFIDVDAIRPTEISSTDAERDAAFDRRDRIAADHSDLAASALRGCSGNCGYLLIRLPDYPNDPEHGALLEAATKSLAARYSDAAIKVDESTFNPSRIMGAVGTGKCKGDPTDDRPHRLVTLDGDDYDPPPFDLADWLLRHPPPEPEPEPEPKAKLNPGPKSKRADAGGDKGQDTWVGTTVADDFAAKVDWEDKDLLGGSDGWNPDAGLTSGERRWTRPGKGGGTSATTDHDGRPVFKVFSGNASPFVANEAYSKFQVFAILHHGGDASAAGKDLYAKGYGTRQPRRNGTARRISTNGKPARDRVSNDPVEDDAVADLTDLKALTDAELGLIPMTEIRARPVVWTWKHRLEAAALNLLAGDAGIGKSQILLAIAAAYSTGGDFPDRTKAPLGRVVIVAAEDNPSTTIKPRLMALGADLGRILIVKAKYTVRRKDKPDLIRFASFQDRDYWKEVFHRAGPQTLFIADPIPSYLGRGVNDAKNTEIREVMEPFIHEVIEPFGICMIGNTHLNKAVDAKTPLHRISGSIAYGALPRAVHIVVRDPDDPRRKFFQVAKVNEAPDDVPALAFRVEPREVEGEGGEVIETAVPVFESEGVSINLNAAINGRTCRRGFDPVRTTAMAEWLFDHLDGQSGWTHRSDLFAAAGEAGYLGTYDEKTKRWSNIAAFYRAKDLVAKLPEPRAGKRIDEHDMKCDGDRYPRVCYRLLDADSAF